jgi:putative ABC transport system substrate-binding protein
MRRREFIGLLGGTAAWPLIARAQQAERMRHIGLLAHLAADDPQMQTRVGAFLQGLQQSGWAVGRNLRIDFRWAAGNTNNIPKFAAELAALSPEVVLASTSLVVAALQQTSRSMPVVFVQVIDPVGGGFVDSLARPGRNATGFMNFEYGLSGKWLELLKQTAPSITRVAVIRDPAIAAGTGQLGAIQGVAPSFGVELVPISLQDAGELERGIAHFVRGSSDGLIVTASPLAIVHSEAIITLATRYKLPAVYFDRSFVSSGGLISYGPDLVEQWRGAAGYVDRILRGEKPADLPVQAPTKYELLINLKTAKALGMSMPPTLLARADEVIE